MDRVPALSIEIEAAAASDEVETAGTPWAQRFPLAMWDHHSFGKRHPRMVATRFAEGPRSAMQNLAAQPIDLRPFARRISNGAGNRLDRSGRDSKCEGVPVFAFFPRLDAAESLKRSTDVTETTERANAEQWHLQLTWIDRLLPTRLPPNTEPIARLSRQHRSAARARSKLATRADCNRRVDSWNLAIMTEERAKRASRSGQSGVTVMSSGQQHVRRHRRR